MCVKGAVNLDPLSIGAYSIDSHSTKFKKQPKNLNEIGKQDEIFEMTLFRPALTCFLLSDVCS